MGVWLVQALWTSLAKGLSGLAAQRDDPKKSLDMKARFLFTCMRAGHEKENPGCIAISALDEVLSVDQVQGHLGRAAARGVKLDVSLKSLTRRTSIPAQAG